MGNSDRGPRVYLNTEAYKRKLKASRLKNQRIADRLRIDATLLSHYVNGRREMPFEQAVRAADLLGCDVEDIVEVNRYRCTACGCDHRLHGVAA